MVKFYSVPVYSKTNFVYLRIVPIKNLRKNVLLCVLLIIARDMNTYNSKC